MGQRRGQPVSFSHDDGHQTPNYIDLYRRARFVLDVYGWPAGLSEEQILERLVALNAERAAEEARGIIRWLQPEYPAAGGAADISARFRGGRNREQQIEEILATLAALGQVRQVDGQRFAVN